MHAECDARWRNDTYRPVVYQGNFHHGLEFAILYPVRLVTFGDLLDKVLVQSSCLFWRRGAVEVWLCALFRLGQQCELGHFEDKLVNQFSIFTHICPKGPRAGLTTEYFAANIRHILLPLWRPR